MSTPLAPGILIAIEGIDGSGKSTQAKMLAEKLRSIGLEVCHTREPTNGKWGSELRRSAQEGRLTPERELELFMRDRAEHVATCIKPALEHGEVVITDRYYFSTVAYQGARGFEPGTLLHDNEAIAPSPDVLLILDLPVEQALQRIKESREETPNEFEQAALLRASQKIFLDLASSGEQRHVVDASQPQSAIAATLLDIIVRDVLAERLEGTLGREQTAALLATLSS